MAYCFKAFRASLTAAHHLPSSAQISHAGEAAPYVHHTGEREDQKEGHAHKDVQFEQDVHVCQKLGGGAAEGDDMLRPLHQFHHFMAVGMAEADKNGRDTEQ